MIEHAALRSQRPCEFPPDLRRRRALARTQDEADAALDQLLAAGVNHIDAAASYGDAELRIGPWMERHRDRFFLATKTGERSYAARATRSATRSNACASITSTCSSSTIW